MAVRKKPLPASKPRDWEAEAEAAYSRDPRRAPYGIRTGSVFGDGPNVFFWFESLEQLIDFLMEVEPRVAGVTPGDGLEVYHASVMDTLGKAKVDGLTLHLFRMFDPDRLGGFILHWWGRYEDLRDGRDEFGCQVRDDFVRRWCHGDERSARTMEDEFVDFLHWYGI